jgi:hypothetical protein
MYNIKIKKKFYLIFLFILFSSCSCKKKLFDFPLLAKNLPMRIAVLPVRNDSINVGLEEFVQEKFYKEMKKSNWPVQDFNLTNQILRISGDEIFKIDPQKLLKTLKVDGVVYGRIVDFRKITTGIFNEIKVELEFKMYLNKTKSIVWEANRKISYSPKGSGSEGILGQIIVSTVSNLLDSGKDATRENIDRLSCDLPKYE